MTSSFNLSGSVRLWRPKVRYSITEFPVASFGDRLSLTQSNFHITLRRRGLGFPASWRHWQMRECEIRLVHPVLPSSSDHRAYKSSTIFYCLLDLGMHLQWARGIAGNGFGGSNRPYRGKNSLKSGQKGRVSFFVRPNLLFTKQLSRGTGVTIYYSVGGFPTTSSPSCSSPCTITVSSSELIRAMALGNGISQSGTAVGNYTIQ